MVFLLKTLVFFTTQARWRLAGVVGLQQGQFVEVGPGPLRDRRQATMKKLEVPIPYPNTDPNAAAIYIYMLT